MTRGARHQRIADLLERHPVGSQGQLLDLLAEDGIVVTQATLSRDLVDLEAVKIAEMVQAVGGGAPGPLLCQFEATNCSTNAP